MPSFSERSLRNLETCHPDLQTLFHTVVLAFDCTVIEGHRERERQNELLRTGMTTLAWPKSKHNSTPSRAVDVVPYPIDKYRFYWFAGYVLATAQSLQIPIRWGGDWDGDLKWRDQTFHDLPHYELKDIEA